MNEQINNMKKKAEQFAKNPFDQFKKQNPFNNAGNGKFDAESIKKKAKEAFEQAQKKAKEFDHQKANSDFKNYAHKAGSMFREAKEEARKRTEHIRQ